MKKKKIVIGFIIIFIFGTFNLVKKGKATGNHFQIHYLNTDKEVYYNDESININSSWDANPIGLYEEIYIRIEIYDTSEKLLWYSAWDDRTGDDLIGEWNVNIDDLDLSFNNTSNNVSIRFCYLLYDFTGIYTSFPELVEVQAIKRKISCQLIEFTPNVKYGEIFRFKGRFYFSENNTNLSNYLITARFISERSTLYEENFTTNSYGIIEINILTTENLTIGTIILILNLIGNNYFYGSNYEFQLSTVSKVKESPNSERSNSEDKGDKDINNISLIIALLCISFLTILSVYCYNIKKSKGKNLTDLTCRY